MNLWWLRDDLKAFQRLAMKGGSTGAPGAPMPATSGSCVRYPQVPPIDVLPATVQVQQSAPQLGEVMVFGGLMVFQGLDPDDRDQKRLHCDPEVPSLAVLTQQVQDSDRALKECSDGELDRQTADEIARLLNTPVEGYWYQYAAGGDYLLREFHERDSGRLYLREYAQVATRIGYYLNAPRKERIYFDPTAPYFRPLIATGENGTLIAVR